MIPAQADIIRVLIVDELVETRQLIELILRNTGGCELTQSGNFPEAVELVSAGKIDLVLCEARNDHAKSLNFCRQLKADSKIEHIPLILYSSVHNRDQMLGGFEAGAVDYLLQPLFPLELAARVRTHFQLKRQKDITIQKVVEQQKLIHIMCHDILGPLSASLQLLELAREEPELLEDSLEDIIRSLGKVVELTEMVRELQAVEDGKKEWVLEPLDLKETITDAAIVFKDRLEKKGIILVDEIEPGYLVQVERVSFVNSVLANLLSNSIKFSSEHSTITLRVRREADKLVLIVEDRGIGMPKNILDNLFNLQVPTTRPGTQNERGTGYGMPLVKNFVESYGGLIQVKSKDIEDHPKNHGTIVKLILLAG